ncbi:hypothetical protein Afil01_23450 [Actinorhabdospora filicis]|uniref:Uncharacterized protein n=1 Tax=Actinorhabdospora filicis TaxID=1785913 RepID=A0A9W6SJS6_9ACTN|nr:hypothetical protein [Actinorhabdospora filicis]GLZ77538.1 hypothetical protein Afil01_23450 [Actinorhabdospora filicis]
MNRADAETLIRDSITHRAEPTPGLVDKLGAKAVYMLIAAAVVVAAERKFPEGTPIEELRAYAESLHERYPHGAEAIDTTLAEHVLRSLLEGEELLQPYDFGDVLQMMFILAYALMSPENLDEAAFHEYFSHVYELASAEV